MLVNAQPSRVLPMLLLFLGLWSSWPAHSEDLAELIQLASKQDAKYLAAEHNYKATLENPVIARAELYPRASIQVDRSETIQDIVRADNPLFTGGRSRYPTDSYLLAIEQPLFNWQAYKRIDQAETESFQARTRLWEARQELTVRTVEAYFSVLAARTSLSQSLAEKAVVAKHLEQAREQHQRGFAAKPDVADAEARLALVEADEIEGRNLLQDAIQALVELTDYRPLTLEDLNGETRMQPPDPDNLEWWLETTIAQNPILQARRQAVEIAKQEIKLRGAVNYPTLDLVGRYGKRDTGGAIFGGSGTEVDTTELLLSLTIPIYQGQRVSAQVRQAGELLSVALAEEEQTRRALERETRASFLGINNAIKRAAALQQAVNAQGIALEAKREGFKRGLFSSVDVLDAEKLLTKAKVDYQRARYEYFVSLLRLHKAKGSIETEDLERVNAFLTRTVALND